MEFLFHRQVGRIRALLQRQNPLNAGRNFYFIAFFVFTLEYKSARILSTVLYIEHMVVADYIRLQNRAKSNIAWRKPNLAERIISCLGFAENQSHCHNYHENDQVKYHRAGCAAGFLIGQDPVRIDGGEGHKSAGQDRQGR